MRHPSTDSGQVRELSGRRALVTAGSRNLGAAIARALATHGAQVALTYHGSQAEAHALVTELRQQTGLDHVAVPADLAEPQAVSDCCQRAMDALGGLEVLVNNYGPFSIMPLHELPYEQWRRVWAGNVETAYLASAAAVPAMRRAGWGRIVNISAGSAFVRNHSIYGLAKDAIGTLTESLAVELGPEITVNAVAPGQIAESAAEIGAIDASFVARTLERTPAGRLVTRAEVGEVVALLCTRAFDMLTGAVLPMDGGARFGRL